MTLAPGFHAVPDGHLATVVTHLEMTAPPPARDGPAPDGLALEPVPAPRPEAYRDLFRRVGADWLWQSRLVLDDAALGAILGDPGVEVSVLRRAGEDAGMLELDFREAGACEIAFFGVVTALQGTGAARWMMARALVMAWARPIRRLWVHTCTLDHPAAPRFYRRSGFAVTHQEVEVLPDPRLTGTLPRAVAPHVPLAAPLEHH